MKIICIGRNYADHIKELNNEVPENPVIFLKPDTALLKDNKPFFIPPWSKEMHYETELVFKISKNGKFIQEKFAYQYISHYTLGIDFTERYWQNNLKAKGLPWELSKAFDNSAVIGNWKEFNQEKINVQDINFYLDINGVKKQEGNSCNMIYPVAKIISFVSEFFTLKTGDLIFSGTPFGVGTVSPEDVLTGFLENEVLFDFKIK